MKNKKKVKKKPDRFIELKHFQDIKQHIIHNYQIADFYMDRYETTHDPLYLGKSKYIDSCGKYYSIDHYKFSAVKDIKTINLCKDKFCFNCQSVLAQARQQRFAPILDQYRDNNMVAHIIFTVKNCEPEELMPLIKKMYKKFLYIIRYLNGTKEITGINFLKYQYSGAVRGLEVTYNKKDDNYHPHFHCMVLLKKDLDLKGKYINSFSFDKDRFGNKILVRKFSEFEILLQKIWYLIMNDIRVTKLNIDNLKEGYSVMVEDSQGHYHECFKYSCKGLFKDDEGACIYSERVFWTLYEALHGKRVIQGYGLLHNFTDLEKELTKDEATKLYKEYIEYLQGIEKPHFCAESLDDVIEGTKTAKYFSKKTFFKLAAERRKEEEKG